MYCMKTKVLVIGCGRWGTFIAWYLNSLGLDVSLYGRSTSKNMKELQEKRGNAYLKLYINGYCVERNYNGVMTTNKVEESECEIPENGPESNLEKKIGDYVYYNPVLNDYCTDYEEGNSEVNSATGCLKWYIYGINENDYSLILDHTLTITDSYTSGESIFSNYINGYV